MLMPVLISSLAHDFVKVQYNYFEEDFKAAVFAHRIHENLVIAEHMQEKQEELIRVAAKKHPELFGGMSLEP